MRTSAKLAASVFAIAASALTAGCAGDHDARRAQPPTSAPETTRFGTESSASPSATNPNKGFERAGRGDDYGSERGAKNPGGDISPLGGKSPGGDVGQTPGNPDVSPRSLPCPDMPPGGGHGSSGIKPGPMGGGDARTTDCPDWNESEQRVPGGRGTIQ